MGSLAEPVTAELALALRDRLDLRICVETGTRHGNSTAWAAAHFPRVVTIEIDIRTQDNALRKYSALNNVSWLTGDSRGVLPDVIAHLTSPTLFWLDAHDADDCPVMEELSAIAESPLQHCILIDDADCFIRPPPLGINAAGWPTAAQIEEKAYAMGYVCRRVRDLIVLVPPHVAPVVARS